MTGRGILKKLPIDTYMVMLIVTVLLATILPVSGGAATVVSKICYMAVALLFFLYGARLKSQTILAGVSNWKLQLLVTGATFVFFPLAGWGLASLVAPWLTDELVTGLIFLCILPSTVQSSIALTAIARGNVPAAICAASLSNVLGVVLTPALAVLFLSANDLSLNADSITAICMQLLLPFAAGQLVRPLIGKWLESRRTLTQAIDRGSILLIVYSAFSAGVVAGIWGRLDGSMLVLLIVFDLFLLVTALLVVKRAGRLVGLSREDEVTLLFCGSQKSLASGIPIANILFAGYSTALIVLPLMLYHQLQLFVCTAMANSYARSEDSAEIAIAEQSSGASI